jgi:LysR family transcriptional regulator, carnitine catabolism transcriptional activator
MDLRQLSYVVAVVDEGGFTSAAKAMHVAQPSLSQAVRTLESELGVELFHRTSRTVTLTAAGEALLEPARQALRDASNVREAVAAVAGLEAGHLDIVCLPTLAVHPAAELIGRFRRDHPGITVRVAEPEDTDAVAERVRSASSEVGLTELPVTGPGLVTHPLEVQEYVALIPTDLDPTLTRAGRITIRELAEQPLVTSPQGTSTRRLIDDAFLAAGLQSRIAVETDHREAIGPLVNAGGGAAVLPRQLADHTASPGVVIAEIVPPITRSVGLIHRGGPLSPAARAFLDLALGTDHGVGRPPPPRRR